MSASGLVGTAVRLFVSSEGLGSLAAPEIFLDSLHQIRYIANKLSKKDSTTNRCSLAQGSVSEVVSSVKVL